MALASGHLSREGGISGTRGIGGPRANTQYYGDHAIGVMSSVIRASPRDRWPDISLLGRLGLMTNEIAFFHVSFAVLDRR